MTRWASITASCVFLSAGAFLSCAPERAELEVELVPPVASRFVVHGNCFAGWYMVVDIVVHERRHVSVVLDSVSLRVEDERTGAPLGERMDPVPSSGACTPRPKSGYSVNSPRGRVDPGRAAAKRVMENGARSTGEARPRTRPATISPMSGPIRMPLR